MEEYTILKTGHACLCQLRYICLGSIIGFEEFHSEFNFESFLDF